MQFLMLIFQKKINLVMVVKKTWPGKQKKAAFAFCILFFGHGISTLKVWVVHLRKDAKAFQINAGEEMELASRYYCLNTWRHDIFAWIPSFWALFSCFSTFVHFVYFLNVQTSNFTSGNGVFFTFFLSPRLDPGLISMQSQEKVQN